MEAVDDARDRLDERGLFVAELADRVDVRPRRDDVVGEASVARDADRVPVQAVVALVTLAEEAVPAEDARVDGHAVADLEVVDAGADLCDLAGQLVAADQRVRREEVAVEDVLIGAADAARGDADEDLVRPRLGSGHVAHLDRADGLIERCFHFTAPNVRPRTSDRCASQPASTTGATATVEAADIFAQKSPSLVMNPEM